MLRLSRTKLELTGKYRCNNTAQIAAAWSGKELWRHPPLMYVCGVALATGREHNQRASEQQSPSPSTSAAEAADTPPLLSGVATVKQHCLLPCPFVCVCCFDSAPPTPHESAPGTARNQGSRCIFTYLLVSV